MIAPNRLMLNGGYAGVESRILPVSRPAQPITTPPGVTTSPTVTKTATSTTVPKTGNPIIDSLLAKATATKTAVTPTPTASTTLAKPPGMVTPPPPPGAPARGTAIPAPAPTKTQAPTPGVPTQPTQLSPSPSLPPDVNLSPGLATTYRSYGYQSTGVPYASPVPGSLPTSLSGSATAPPTLGMLSAPGDSGVMGSPLLWILLGAGVLILIVALR